MVKVEDIQSTGQEPSRLFVASSRSSKGFQAIASAYGRLHKKSV